MDINGDSKVEYLLNMNLQTEQYESVTLIFMLNIKR